MPDLPFGLRIVFLAALLGVNSFFAAAEVALVSVRRTRVRQLAEAGSRPARLALDLIESPDRLLSATQLGVTLASLALGWAAESTLYGPLAALLALLPVVPTAGAVHVLSFGVAFFLITFLHMVLGEVVPKHLALARAERLALAVAPPLQLFARASRFFVTLVQRSAAAVSRMVGLHAPEAQAAYSADELKHVFAAIALPGRAGRQQREMLRRAIDFYDLTAREVMVPRKDLVSLADSASLDQVLDCLVRTRHTRLPIYAGSPENLVGVLHAKDFWAFIQQVRRWQLLDRPAPPFHLKSFMRELEFVPETKELFELLREFQQRRRQMAAVVDEFGTVAGVVTAEDAIEQIVGEIREEHEPPEPRAPEGSLELDGITNIVDLDARYGIELPYDAGFETLAGFLLSRLGHIPEAGECIAYGDRTFTVTGMEGNRIGTVLVEPALSSAGAGTAEERRPAHEPRPPRP